VIISYGGILAVPARTNHTCENPATGYEHRITASTFLTFFGVSAPEPARTLSSGYEYDNARRENDSILLLKVRRKSEHSSKEHLSQSSSLSAKMKKK
jgi:hypothetical protein